MKSQVLQRIIRRLAPLAAIVGFVPAGQAQFVHPGCLSVQADFNRMATNVVAGNHPWVDSYNNLCAYSQAQTNWGWAPVPVIYRCGSGCTNNFSRSQQDALAIYYNALRYRITGDVNFANHAIQGMDAWSGTCTNVSGDSNWALAAGLCGYEFACAGEELRGYSGWSPTSLNNYSNFLENVFIAGNLNFLINHNGTCDTHYRCNWDACNMASLISCSVFCDDTNNFNQAIAYYTNGIGNGNIFRAVDFVHPDGLGQEEESGRDQAHTMDGVNSLSTFCQVAWNQGVDMYGYDHNRYLRILEYVAKANIFSNTWVPYVHHRNCLLTYDEASLAGAPIGIGQYFWETPAAHYVNVAGLAAPWTAKMAAASRPDSGIANWNSPDWFGFTTLTSYRGPATNGVAAPGDLTATVKGAQITLNWWGTALATSYNVKRAAVSGGPYTTIAVTGPDNLSYVDTGLAPGTAYYYVVSANQPGGESANSTELATAPNDLIAGAVIGSPGSYNNTGATIVNAFDNSFETFYDATNASGDWTGIDPGLGASSVGCVITRIEYAPRPGFAGRMVGGEFQGALDGDPGFANPITLYTVTNQPADGFVTAQNGVLTSVPV
ncbi:MAG TPA: alginate lyase family protein, partial [Verrucomicrobiae bacterium]|nr:alginate lyase family protein [Verrucomicrobiae bacterium]